MKISRMIRDLQQKLDRFGDLELSTNTGETGFTRVTSFDVCTAIFKDSPPPHGPDSLSFVVFGPEHFESTKDTPPTHLHINLS